MYCTILYHTTPYYTILLYCAVLYYTVLRKADLRGSRSRALVGDWYGERGNRGLVSIQTRIVLLAKAIALYWTCFLSWRRYVTGKPDAKKEETDLFRSAKFPTRGVRQNGDGSFCFHLQFYRQSTSSSSVNSMVVIDSMSDRVLSLIKSRSYLAATVYGASTAETITCCDFPLSLSL